jgi:hypothetical protein
MIIKSNKSGLARNFHNLIKVISEKLIGNIIITDERLNAFPIR